jgi:hypothetical protein
MPKKGDVHVIRGNSGGWQVRVEGTARARSIRETQAEGARVGPPGSISPRDDAVFHDQGEDTRIGAEPV